jgi:hypothetical protein
MGLAAVRCAVVRAVDRVHLDERLAAAQTSATPQVRVERLDSLGGAADEEHEWDVAQLGLDVDPDLRLVRHARGGIDLVLGHPTVQERPYGRFGAADLQGVRLGLEPREDLLSLAVGLSLGALAPGLGSGLSDLHRLVQDDPLAGARVRPGGDARLPPVAVPTDAPATAHDRRFARGHGRGS